MITSHVVLRISISVWTEILKMGCLKFNKGDIFDEEKKNLPSCDYFDITVKHVTIG